ncbi:MAG TPA: VacJ family lipoprotein [Xanthomonadales bacterium]|nr:VacJ family lipoprotein [Xanthomonadales bacterium]
MSRPIAALALLLALAGSGCAMKAQREEIAPVDRAASKSAIAGIDAYDPWEPFNRKVFAANKAFDDAVFKPAARGYVKVVPQPVRRGVGNVINNLKQPVVALNAILQGKPKQAGHAVGRFLLNSTVGIAGIFDVASKAHVPYHENDFGQTFAIWGWKRSRYLVVPLFGASTVRDGLGRLTSTQVDLVRTVWREAGWGAAIVIPLHARASALPNEAFSEGAPDEYVLLRDVFFQRRACQIRDCSQDLPEYELPEDLMPDEAAKE